MFGEKKHKHKWKTIPVVYTEVINTEGNSRTVARIVECCDDCGCYQSILIPTKKQRERFEVEDLYKKRMEEEK